MHGHGHHSGEGKNIRTAFFLNLGFTLVELVGGILTNSVAILSDALHDLGDSLSLGMAWYLEKLSNRKGDDNYSYGYKRFSLLGALINAVVLLVGTIYILAMAVPRLLHPEAVDAKGMMGLAVLGVIVNGAAMLQLRKGSSLNLQMVSFHLLEDVLGWVAVLIGSVVIWLFDWPVIDPILSIGISVFILYNVIRGLRQVLRIILQGTPSEIGLPDIKEKLTQLPEIVDLHDIHLWSLDGRSHILTMHVVLWKGVDLDDREGIKRRIRQQLQSLPIGHVTMELEVEGEVCSVVGL